MNGLTQSSAAAADGHKQDKRNKAPLGLSVLDTDESDMILRWGNVLRVNVRCRLSARAGREEGGRALLTPQPPTED